MPKRIFTQEHRRKLSIANKGKPSNMGALGKHHKLSDEQRKKWSEVKKGKKGKDATAWKGGLTPINQRIRVSLEYKLWRKSVLQRDNFIDQKTGEYGGDLVVHHINNFSEFPELRFAIDNGITFRKKTHQIFHKIYGIKNNTREQLNEFLL